MARNRATATLAGALLVAVLSVGGAVGLYSAFLPSHLGPENASPPPEGVGAILGAVLGCGTAIAIITFAARSTATALSSFIVADCLGSLYWIVLGHGNVGGRIADILLVQIVGVVSAAIGVALGVAAVGLRNAAG